MAEQTTTSMSLLDFLKTAGSTTIDIYRTFQGQDPVMRSESGAMTSTANNQSLMMIVLLLGFIMVIALFIRR